MDNAAVVKVLNNLIEVSKDGEYGFKECAEFAKLPSIKAVLSARADDCASSASELQRIVEGLGGMPDTAGSALGAVHRGWVAVRTTLTSKDDIAVLEEAERGEDKALKQYREAASQDLPAPEREVVRRQLNGTKTNHDQIKSMRDRLKAAS